MSNEITCPRCKGKGWVAVYVERGCPYIQDTCPGCGGSGKVTADEEETPPMPESYRNDGGTWSKTVEPASDWQARATAASRERDALALERATLKTQIEALDQRTDGLQFKVKAVERLVRVLTTERDEANAACAQLEAEADVTDEALAHLECFPALSPDPQDSDEVPADPKEAWEAGFERALEIVGNKIALIDRDFPLRPYRVFLEDDKEHFEILQGRSPRHAKRQSRWYCKEAWLSIKAIRVREKEAAKDATRAL